MTEILDGKAVAQGMYQRIKADVARLERKPGLAVVLVGDDPASQVYVNIKVRTCKELGIVSTMHRLDKETSQAQLLALVKKLNADSAVNGILVQLPVPKQIDAAAVMQAVIPEKDVDGFHPFNVGSMMLGAPTLISCTPMGVVELLDAYDVPLEGKDVVVIGKSVIVGRPMAELLLGRGATVTVCHSKTKDLARYTRTADIVVSAAGRPGLVTAGMVKEGVIIVDVGTTKVDGKLKGDVDYEAVAQKASLITPVPGGVGPMTVACLMKNTLLAYKRQNGLEDSS